MKQASEMQSRNNMMSSSKHQETQRRNRDDQRVNKTNPTRVINNFQSYSTSTFNFILFKSNLIYFLVANIRRAIIMGRLSTKEAKVSCNFSI